MNSQKPEIKLKNTLSGEIEKFNPVIENKVSMYHCGPTVYNQAHLGNLKPYILADLMRRTFEYAGYDVKQVINITDVGHLTDDGDEGEDKIEKAAKEKRISAKEITQHYTELFLNDLRLLNIEIEKVIFPKATDYIDEQIKFIEDLEKKGVTYQTSDGIYFDTSKFSDYGKLGRIDLKGISEGYRIGKNSEKKNPTDFALWKFSPKNEKRLQEWDSPWGIGFPGWHIECSVMSQELLGKTFDIHTGGTEHIPVHHNNEIAQSECLNNKVMANYWLHSNHLLLNGEKMSKSLGNVFYLPDLVMKYDPIIFRYWILTSKYDSLINFTDEAVASSDNAFKKIINSLKDTKSDGEIQKEYLDKILSAIFDDFNTPIALAEIWNLIKDSNISQENKKTTILEADKILGLNLKEHIERAEQLEIPEEIEKLAEQRQLARNESDWQKADSFRQKIEEKGYKIKDLEGGYKIDKQ